MQANKYSYDLLGLTLLIGLFLSLRMNEIRGRIAVEKYALVLVVEIFINFVWTFLFNDVCHFNCHYCSLCWFIGKYYSKCVLTNCHSKKTIKSENLPLNVLAQKHYQWPWPAGLSLGKCWSGSMVVYCRFRTASVSLSTMVPLLCYITW